MADEPQKHPPGQPQSAPDDERRKELAFIADQAAVRALGKYTAQKHTSGYAQSDTITELAKALVKAQAAFTVPAKTKKAEVKKDGRTLYSYTYADLAGIREAVSPALTKFGLVYIQPILQEAEDLFLVTKLIHADSGEWVSTRLPLGLRTADPQAIGSAMTYMRRYGLCSLLGIAAEDDDDGSRESATRPGDNRHTQPLQTLPGRFGYRYDDEIIWALKPKLETKRIAAMTPAELKTAEERIVARGKQAVAANVVAVVADCRRDLDLVRAALKVMNDSDFTTKEPDAGKTPGVPKAAPGEEEAGALDEVPGRTDVPSGEAKTEGGQAEEVAGMGPAPGADQAPEAPVDSEGAIDENAYGDRTETSGTAEDKAAGDVGQPGNSGGLVRGSGQGEPAPGREGKASNDDVPSPATKPDPAPKPDPAQPSGGPVGQPSSDGPGKSRPADYLKDPRRDETIPDKPATLSLADGYKVNAMKGLDSQDQAILAELNDGEVQALVMNCQELFSLHADGLQKARLAMPADRQVEPLTGPWVAYVWYPYHEENKATRKDARKLAKVAMTHHQLPKRHADRRAAKLGPEAIAREQSAVEALKNTFGGKTVKGGAK